MFFLILFLLCLNSKLISLKPGIIKGVRAGMDYWHQLMMNYFIICYKILKKNFKLASESAETSIFM